MSFSQSLSLDFIDNGCTFGLKPKIINNNLIKQSGKLKMIQNTEKSYYLNSNKTYHKINTAECRICYQNIQIEFQQQYCSCSGNMKFVHQNCLLKWINQSKTYEEGNNQFSYCQVCKGRISLKSQKQVKLKSLKQIINDVFCNQKIEARIKRIIFFLVLLLLIATLIILVNVMITDQSRRGTKLCIALLVLNSVFFVGGVVYFFALYIVERKSKITGIRGFYNAVNSQKYMQSQELLNN